MAVEPQRKCGYRKVGGIYIVSSPLDEVCSDLPLEIPVCPCCGNTIEFFRGIRRINPNKLWKTGGWKCTPHPDKAWFMWIGKHFYPTPADFIEEAQELGVSKRIPFVPDELQTGDVVFLAHKKGIRRNNKFVPAVVAVFTIKHVERIISEKQSKKKSFVKKLRERGLTPIIVPDDDPDHRGSVYKDLKREKKRSMKALDEW